MKNISLSPIGTVRNAVKKPRFGSFKSEISEIVVDKKYTEALNGIGDYSHVIIVW
jgi:tRNA (Thr-GGU) A37 N-methylase